ncbi:hypothetical protein N7373_02560 [Achromobacter mucicolens]|uniref:hypothetical protein n=1 Tax=Achromobacter mucicolens TaxID=1389922 RepID=UPI0024479C4D|nr:hypothetical protein [Achromobacter mucicolens]MDH0090314.1 hypothetical protein [Achromobacter mucicolens]
MIEPVLIIHGVNNHDYAPFAQRVRQLQHSLGPGVRLIPAHWGDQGGLSTNLEDCLPVFRDGEWNVRAQDAALSMPGPALTRAIVGLDAALDNPHRVDLICGALQASAPVRGDRHAWLQPVRDGLAARLGSTRVLQFVDDPQTLAIIGRTIDAMLRELPQRPAALPGGHGVRGESGAVNGEDVRGLAADVQRIVGDVIQGFDEALGRVIGNQVGRMNQAIRGRLAVPVSATLGDIMTYQRQPDRVQAALRKTLATEAPGYGSQAQPISVIAHSLGGVVAFDAAVKPLSEDKRLWIKSFVTFGSQAAFFHIVDPRLPELRAYRRNAPVELPASIARWTNLWNPMDLLAFTAGTVFRLADGSTPLDICVQDSASELLAKNEGPHTAYWASDELTHAVQAALT